MIIIIAITLILAGLFFYARAIGVVDDETMNLVWPLLLVVLGLGVLACGTMGHKCSGKNCWTCEPVDWTGQGKGKKKKRK